MSKDREILESLYARWNADEPEIGLDLFHEDVEVRQNPDIVDTARTFHGHAGVEEAVREFSRAFRLTKWTVEAWVQEAEWLIARVTIAATGRASGVVGSLTIAHAWKLHDGKVTHLFHYPTVSAAVRALQAADADG